jgi:hypothetical protein
LLLAANDAISYYLKIRKVCKAGGNHDVVTQWFVFELFEIWRRLLFVRKTANETEMFERFIWAAWQDVGFPTEDDEGRSVKAWLADRLRKQFPKGLSRSPKDLAEAEYKLFL